MLIRWVKSYEWKGEGEKKYLSLVLLDENKKELYRNTRDMKMAAIFISAKDNATPVTMTESKPEGGRYYNVDTVELVKDALEKPQEAPSEAPESKKRPSNGGDIRDRSIELQVCLKESMNWAIAQLDKDNILDMKQIAENAKILWENIFG